MMKLLLVAFLALIVALLPGCEADSGTVARVERIIDGDTIEITGGERVRYIGIDTPEIYPEEEYYGPEASALNRELVEGKMVVLESDITDRDRYGRLLRYVFVDDVFVNGEMVRLGYAHAVSYPPDTRYQKLLVELETEAREAGRGLWKQP